jgi:hypothetical protein
MDVVDAVQRDIERLGPEVQESGLAAAALALAAGLDDQNSLTSKSMAAKALADVLKELRSLAPPRKETDDLAKLRADRKQRRSGGAAPADSARS